MTAPSRPKRVVIVDADNPLVEIEGEFFWREDHDAIVSAARDQAYRDGYRGGWNEAALQAGPQTIIFRRRRTLLGQLKLAILALVLIACAVIIAITIGQQLLSQR